MRTRFIQLWRRIGGAGGSAGQIAWLVGDRVARLLVGFVVMAAVARYLGPASFGLLANGLALIGLLMFIPGLGWDDIVRRELLVQTGREAQILGTVGRLRLAVGGMVALGVFGFALWGAAGTSEERRLWMVLAVMLIQPALWMPESYFQVKGQAKVVAVTQLVSLVLGGAARLGLIMQEASLIWFGVVVLGEVVLVTVILGARAARSGLAGWWREWDGSQVRGWMREGWPLLLAGAAATLYMRVDLVMVRSLAGEREAGVYAAAVRLSEALYFLPIAVITGLLPRWKARRAEGEAPYARFLQRVYDLQAGLAFGFVVGALVFGGWLVARLFGPAFADSGAVLAVHAWTALFVFVGLTRGQEWIWAGLNRYTLLVTTAGAAANVGLNSWLIPQHGAMGAAVATLGAYVIAAGLLPLTIPATRPAAWRQTKALLVPLRGWRYLRGG